MPNTKTIIEEYDNKTYFFTMPEGVSAIVINVFEMQMNLRQQPTIRNIIHQLPFELITQVNVRTVDRKPTDEEKQYKSVILKHSLNENA